MKYSYLFYDQLGKITHVQVTSEVCERDFVVPLGGGYIKGEVFDHSSMEWQNYYVSDGRVREREEMNISQSGGALTANGVEEVVLNSLPEGAIVEISGALDFGPHRVDDGEIIITSDKAGPLKIRVACEPRYLEWSCDIDAN